jgi:hypothetical protein
MIKWLLPSPPVPAAPQTLNSQPLPSYTDQEANRWHLTGVKPSAVPGFIEATRVEDGAPVKVHHTAVSL